MPQRKRKIAEAFAEEQIEADQPPTKKRRICLFDDVCDVIYNDNTRHKRNVLAVIQHLPTDVYVPPVIVEEIASYLYCLC